MAQITSSPTVIVVGSYPAWMPPPGQFTSISLANPSSVDPCPTRKCVYSSNEGFASIWTAWNGGAYAPSLGAYGSMLLFGGGHSSYDGNEVIAYDVADRQFKRLSDPAPYKQGPDVDVDGSYPDGTPYPNHTNMGCDFLPPEAGGGTQGSYVFLGHGQTGVTIRYSNLWRFDLHTRTWLRWRLPTNVGRFPALAYDSKRRGLWAFSTSYYDPDMIDAQNRRLFFIDVVKQTQIPIGINGSTGILDPRMYLAGIEYVESRDCLVMPLNGSVTGLPISCINLNGCVVGITPWVPQFTVTQSGAACKSLWSYPDGGASDNWLNHAATERFAYCSRDGNLYVLDMHDNTAVKLYQLAPPPPNQLQTGVWVWTSEALTPRAGETLALRSRTVDSVKDKHLYGRFRYAPGISSFLLSDDSGLPAQALRPLAFT